MLRVFEISRMTNHNGPGIRTLVHFKGCPLRCVWCSTPESQQSGFQLLLKGNRCIGDLACVQECPQSAISFSDNAGSITINRQKCAECFRCTEVCHSKALTVAGRDYTVDSLLYEICKDEVFFRFSKGGVTFSGGEPLMHMDDDMEELYRRIHEKHISIGIDTTGFVPWTNIERILPYTDFFLWDLKYMDSDKHRQFTGVGNELILENLTRLNSVAGQYGIRIYIRCVQIPGMTDDPDNLMKTCDFLETMKENVEEIALLNFHHLGKQRYEALGWKYDVDDKEPLSVEIMESKAELVRARGFNCRVSM